ncbi:MAG: hypothetical protein OXG56_05415 [Gammaproteobacteria bacterium]|nr:hypothetical protein [Gammaproteobacteria bacterium]
MLAKILFTLLVILVVALVFRTKQGVRQPARDREPDGTHSLSPQGVAYGLIGLLLLISVAVFVIKHQSDNRIVNISVIAKDGESTLYQARHKDIKGRQFLTLDGKQVALGENDRVEMEN